MPGPGRLAIEQQGSGLRKEILIRIFGVDAALDGVPPDRQRPLFPRQRPPGGHRKLGLHEIHAGNGFGDRMLDLQPRVHLQEIELRVVPASLEKELDRPRVAVIGCPRRGNSSSAHLVAKGRSQCWRWAFLDDLLMATLE